MRALPFTPPHGSHTAGAERRAAERALDRLMLDDPRAAEAQLRNPGKPPKAFVVLFADELTRVEMPSRRQRRASRPRIVKQQSYTRGLVASAAVIAQAKKLERLQTDTRYRAAQAGKRELAALRETRRRRV